MQDKSRLILISWLGVILLSNALSAQSDLKTKSLFFPQVAKGGFNNITVETILIVSNPGAIAAEVRLGSLDFGLIEPGGSDFVVEPGETRLVKISGGEFAVGWLSLSSEQTIAASAQIVTKAAGESEEPISQVTVLAQPPGAKVIIPVFVNSGRQGGQGPRVDNTGVAIAAIHSSCAHLTLVDTAGKVVSTASKGTGFDGPRLAHLAAFVTELFEDIPANFTEGSLIVEGPEEIPRTIAAAALYTRGDDLWVAGATPIDTPGGYFVTIKPGLDVLPTIEALASQYGFEFLELLPPPSDVAFIRSLDTVAQAVSRDPRVEAVSPNGIAFTASGNQ